MSTGALYLQQIINGLSLGAMYALLALGFTLVYGILELINFAHFNVFMVASFFGMAALELLGLSGQSHLLTGFALVGALLFALVVTMVLSGVLGVVIERLALRPLRGVPGTAAMITTIGVSYILLNIVLLTLGAGSWNFPNPMPRFSWNIGGAVLELRSILIWVIAVVLMTGLHLFVTRTRLGKAMRATAANRDLARNCGIRTDRVVMATWLITGSLCGLAGVVFGMDSGTFGATSTDIFLVLILAAVFLGGPGEPYGAMVGALVIGLATEISAAFIVSDYKYVVAFVILLGMLAVRPTGLLGARA